MELFEVHHLFYLIFGVLLGILLGGLPGLTPTMGVALCIPFTFAMSPVDGLILLGGIYCGSVYGGSIPAILLNVPGAPASVATTFDGYPMAQQGKASTALALATISSMVGGLIGMFVLLYFSPTLSQFSLKFGPTETFWIAIFGITVIAVISEGNLAKNLLGGCFGIMISLIGINSFTGTTRFTFGQDYLIGGLHIVAVLVGLFAFAQCLKMIDDLKKNDKLMQGATHTPQKGIIKKAFKDIFSRPKAVIMGSSIGTFVGIVPGAGGNIASILAYNEVKRFSKNKQSFGKGNKYGLVASESANNAMVGGSLIPLLSLGIPGSPTAAIFLGGLLIHGIWPGRNLFVEHADVANMFILGMIVSQFIILILGLMLIKYVTHLYAVPSYYIIPMVLAFCMIGTYATQNNLFDVYSMIFLGFVMYLLQKLHFSAAPIALGFILGPIAEEGLLQGMTIGRAQGDALRYFFSSTWDLILVSVTVLSIIFSIWQVLKLSKQTNRKLARGWSLTENIHQTIGWITVGLFSLAALCYVSTLTFEQKLLPQIVLGFTLSVIFVQIIYSLRGKGKPQSKPFSIPYALLGIILVVMALSYTINLLGFYLQTLCFMLLIPIYFYKLKRRRIPWLKTFLIALAFTVGLYLLFQVVMRVPLPLGPLVWIL